MHLSWNKQLEFNGTIPTGGTDTITIIWKTTESDTLIWIVSTVIQDVIDQSGIIDDLALSITPTVHGVVLGAVLLRGPRDMAIAITIEEIGTTVMFQTIDETNSAPDIGTDSTVEYFSPNKVKLFTFFFRESSVSRLQLFLKLCWLLRAHHSKQYIFFDRA